MNARRTLADLLALAAGLCAWALELVAWLAAHLEVMPFGKALQRRTRRDLAQAERFATALVVLAALQGLPAPPPERPRGGRRPTRAPHGFGLRRRRGNDMRAMRRALFPHRRSLSERAQRLSATLGALLEKARTLAPRLAKVPPLAALVVIAPPANDLPPQEAPTARPVFNSS